MGDTDDNSRKPPPHTGGALVEHSPSKQISREILPSGTFFELSPKIQSVGVVGRAKGFPTFSRSSFFHRALTVDHSSLFLRYLQTRAFRSF